MLNDTHPPKSRHLPVAVAIAGARGRKRQHPSSLRSKAFSHPQNRHGCPLSTSLFFPPLGFHLPTPRTEKLVFTSQPSCSWTRKEDHSSRTGMAAAGLSRCRAVSQQDVQGE